MIGPEDLAAERLSGLSIARRTPPEIEAALFGIDRAIEVLKPDQSSTRLKQHRVSNNSPCRSIPPAGRRQIKGAGL
jgi:hypothetical protein